jgi:hypothetical protein
MPNGARGLPRSEALVFGMHGRGSSLTCVALVKGALEARFARSFYVPLQVNLGVIWPQLSTTGESNRAPL